MIKKGMLDLKNNLFILIILYTGQLLIGCGKPNNPSFNNIKSEEDTIKFADEYISMIKDKTPFLEIKESFYCFYENSYNSKREYYTKPLKDIILDDFIMFSYSYDSALVFFIEEVGNKNSGYFATETIFCYKDRNKWKFFDSDCMTTIFPFKDYTLSSAIHKQRQIFIEDGFIDYKVKDINWKYVDDACHRFCGPCIYQDERKLNPKSSFPPEPIDESLFDCN